MQIKGRIADYNLITNTMFRFVMKKESRTGCSTFFFDEAIYVLYLCLLLFNDNNNYNNRYNCNSCDGNRNNRKI